MEDFTNRTGLHFMANTRFQIENRLFEAMQKAGPKLADQVRKTFKAKGARGQEAWIITRNPTPLIKTGALYRSFKSRVERRGTRFEMITSTDKDYAKKHDKGFGRFPRRHFMYFLDRDLDILMKDIKQTVGGQSG